VAIRPRLLLVPEFTEVQWAIRPQLDEWAEVASFDPPGIGDEPGALTRHGTIERGIAELERLGWEKFFVIGDGWGIPAAVGIAEAAEDCLAGLVLTHASLSHSTSGERPAVNPEVYAAFTQLIRQDAPSFVRYGIAQVTGASIDEELADAILARVPSENMLRGWEALTAPADYAETIVRFDCPMLLVKHEGCLMSTDEGFEDAAAAMPEAKTAAVLEAPPNSPEFAAILRDFCEES
jgi:pimeloyl-ACP methyl ester carboxylesterase